MKALISNAVAQAVLNREFVSLSMDGTLRCTFSLIGQEFFTLPKEVRDTGAYDDETSLRALITLRGRTGMALCIRPIKIERAALRLACVASPTYTSVFSNSHDVFVLGIKNQEVVTAGAMLSGGSTSTSCSSRLVLVALAAVSEEVVVGIKATTMC